jgi:protein-S-isoprenylcysteine O-methyltransferase Ste14
MASHIRFWTKLSLRVLALWIVVGLLLVLARPRPAWLAAGAAPIVLGELLRIWAAGHLEKNKKLTVTGPYAHVKNPLYLGSFLVMAGFCLMGTARYGIHWILLGLGSVAFIASYAPRKMRVEYGRLRERFGEAFEAYDRAVPDYIPRLTPYRGGTDRWRFALVLENSELWVALVLLIGMALLVAKWRWGWSPIDL